MTATRTHKHELKFDFFSLKKGQTMLEAFPDLAIIPELALHGSGANDGYLRYCHLLTDAGDSERAGSTLLRINDIELRHHQAWMQAGLKPDDPRQQGAFDFTDEPIAEMCYALLNESGSLMLAYVLAGEQMLWQDVRKMRAPIGTAGYEEELAPANETAPAKKEREARNNRAAWAATQETADKTQRAYDLRGNFFDKLPERIRQLQKDRDALFAGDKNMKTAVAQVARKNEGVAERMARETTKAS